jgi:calcineurin-like phosphoesterase family protein
MTTFFTSDLHLGHANIINLCKRPFADGETMDRTLIDRWNGVVGHEDEVWVIGDFAYRSPKAAPAYLAQLQGVKHLVTGNHDSTDTARAKGWASVQALAEIDLKADGAACHIVMCHYALRTLPRMAKGGLNFYGHSHGRLNGYQTTRGGGQLDVGVDCWDFRPVSLTEILRRIRTLPVMPGGDHHYGGNVSRAWGWDYRPAILEI